MYIELIILDGKRTKDNYTKPSKYFFKGNYAIEQLLLKISEIYFGSKVKAEIEDLLKMRITEDNLNEY
jgi:hypothetical protein